MMSANNERHSDPVARQAADWLMDHRQGPLPPDRKIAFSNWLAESPLHVREYLGVAETWCALQSMPGWQLGETEDLLKVLRGADRDNVVALGAPRPSASHREPHSPARAAIGRRRHWAMALAASVAALLPIAMVLLWIGQRGDTYSTERGEQRSVVLKDGSVVQLNTLTRMVVHFDGSRRRIELPEGEALFRVAHDASRPFLVETRAAVVRAVGTEFNVYAGARGTQVAVIEGKVQVVPREPEKKPAAGVSRDKSAAAENLQLLPIALGARQSVAIGGGAAGDAATRQPQPSKQSATAWVQRRLVFENTSLENAAEEFNRYNQMQIVIDDQELADLRISGVFSADEPYALVKYLETIHGVQVSSSVSEVRLAAGR